MAFHRLATDLLELAEHSITVTDDDEQEIRLLFTALHVEVCRECQVGMLRCIEYVLAEDHGGDEERLSADMRVALARVRGMLRDEEIK